MAPGDYTVLAWDWVKLYSDLNADVLREVEGRGQKITVSPATRINLEVQAIDGSR